VSDNTISTAVTVRWTPEQLGPLVYVMLHDIQDAELCIRTHASETLPLVARYTASAAAVLGTAGSSSTMELGCPFADVNGDLPDASPGSAVSS